MNTKTRKSLVNKMTRANQAISALESNEEVSSRLALMGYTPEKVTELRTLYTEIDSLVTNHKVKQTAQYESTDLVYQKSDEVIEKTANTLGFVKVLLKIKPEYNSSIISTGQNPTSVDKLIKVKKVFYETLNTHPTLKTELQQFLVTDENLSSELALITELEGLRQKQLLLMGQSQAIAESRDAAMEDLFDEIDKLINISKVVFRTDSEKLEIMGVFVRN